MMLSPSTFTNDSVEVTAQYMVQAADWINNLLQSAVKEEMELTPFQFDLCFAFGEPLNPKDADEEEEYEDESDGDENDGDE